MSRRSARPAARTSADRTPIRGKYRDLDIISSAIPFPRDRALRAVDLCCGPGDLGRAIGRTYPNASVDFIDRDPMLLSICRRYNALTGTPGTYRRLDDRCLCSALVHCLNAAA